MPQPVQLHSNEIQDFLSRPPHWLIRWGTTVIFLVIISLLAIGWFVKYPDIIPAQITVTTSEPPVRLVTKTSGRIIFLASDNQPVKPGQKIAYIANASKFEDISYLENFLQNPPSPWENAWRDTSLQLGELQVAHEAFQAACKEIQSFQKLDQIYRQIQSLHAQIEAYHKINNNLHGQQSLSENELKLSERQYQRDRHLHEQKVLASLEFEKTETAYLQQQRAHKNAQATILNNELRIQELQSRIAELKLQTQEKENQLSSAYFNALKALQGQLAVWKRQYILEAPQAGRLNFLKYWSNHQYVPAEQEIAVITPENDEFVGKITLPPDRSGKITKGQKVNIKLLNYPFEEYGMLQGEVGNITMVSQTNQKGEIYYLINVALPQGLKTSYQKQLPAQAELHGQAEIITKELRLLERLLFKVKSVNQ